MCLLVKRNKADKFLIIKSINTFDENNFLYS